MSIGNSHFPEKGSSYILESPAKVLDMVLIILSLINPKGNPNADWLMLDLCGPITKIRSLGLPSGLDHQGLFPELEVSDQTTRPLLGRS